MKQHDMVRRLIPVDYLDLAGVELWLEEMAAKGLHFQGVGVFFAHLQAGQPARVRYHAEPTEEKGDLPPAQTAEYGDMGWTYVGQLGHLALFRTDDPDAPDFHTDPVAQSYTLDRITKRLSRAVWLLLALMAALAAFLVWGALDSAFGPVLRLVKFSSLYSGTVLLLELVFILHFTWEVWGLCRLRKRLRAGVPAQRPDRWRHTGLVRQGYTLLLSVAALIQIGSTAAYFAGVTKWDLELSALDRPAPVLSLAELEGDGYAPDPFGYPGYEGPDRNNFVSYERKPLARIYQVDQAGTVAGERSRLDLEWYDLTLPFLAGPLLEDLMDYELYDLRYVPEWYTMEELSAPGFDQLVVAEDVDYGGQWLFARLGRRVLCLDYTGDHDLTEHLDRVAALFQWDG